MNCTKCGDRGNHFVPPSMGESGFWICETPSILKERLAAMTKQKEEAYAKGWADALKMVLAACFEVVDGSNDGLFRSGARICMEKINNLTPPTEEK